MSYGTNSPFGLRPAQYLGGQTWNGGDYQTFYVPSGYVFANANTALFTNDPVIQDTANSLGGIDTIVNATAGQPIIGSFQGCQYVDTTGIPQTSPYLLTGTTTLGGVPIEVYVTTGDILYEVQIAVGAAGPSDAPFFVGSNVNKNANLSKLAGSYNLLTAAAQVPSQYVGTTPAANPGTGSTRTGLSGYYLASGSIGTGAGTDNVKIVQLCQNLLNNIYGVVTQGNIIFNTALVMINDNPYKGGTGTVGV